MGRLLPDRAGGIREAIGILHRHVTGHTILVDGSWVAT